MSSESLALSEVEWVETSLIHQKTRVRDLIRSRPIRSAFGLPIHVAAPRAAPFSTEPVLSEVEGLGMTEAYYGFSVGALF